LESRAGCESSFRELKSILQFADKAPAPSLLPILRSQQQGEILALLLADPDLELSLIEILLAHLLAYIPGIATAYIYGSWAANHAGQPSTAARQSRDQPGRWRPASGYPQDGLRAVPVYGARGAQRPERKETGTGRASPADGYDNHAKMRVSPVPPGQAAVRTGRRTAPTDKSRPWQPGRS
jgi:hypothetical protein